ncbi:11567_t:CDS:2, partial [Funneliformis caledonium]
MRNEYVVTILHTAINIIRDSTGEELSMRPEYKVIGDDSTGQKAENLICVTEDKPEQNLIE